MKVNLFQVRSKTDYGPGSKTDYGPGYSNTP